MLVDENFKQRLRRLFSVMIPILITQTAIMAMNFFDSSMSGHAGAVDLAGTSIGGNIWMPIFVGTNGVLLGAMPIVAHLLGADKRDNIGKVIRHTIFLAIAFSAVIILMGVLFLDTLLIHLHLEPQVHYIAKMYMGGGGRRCDTVFYVNLAARSDRYFGTYRYHNEDLFAGAAGKCLFELLFYFWKTGNACVWAGLAPVWRLVLPTGWNLLFLSGSCISCRLLSISGFLKTVSI